MLLSPVKTSRHGKITTPTREKAIGMLRARQSCRKVSVALGLSKPSVYNIATNPSSCRPRKQRQGRKEHWMSEIVYFQWATKKKRTPGSLIGQNYNDKVSCVEVLKPIECRVNAVCDALGDVLMVYRWLRCSVVGCVLGI